jgi:hypothetical protein
MAQYTDTAWVMSCRSREEFDHPFRLIVTEQVLTARYYRRPALTARSQGDMVLYRELAIRAMQSGRSAYLLCIDCELTVGEIEGSEIGSADAYQRYARAKLSTRRRERSGRRPHHFEVAVRACGSRRCSDLSTRA